MNRRVTLSTIGLLVAVLTVSVAHGSPISYWQFDSDFTDAMGNNDGVPQNSPTITTAPGEFVRGTGALKLVRSSQQYLKVDGLNDDLTTGTAFSVTGWFNTTFTPPWDYAHELFSAHTPTGGNVFRVSTGMNGGIFLARAGGAEPTLGSGYNDGQWHFLAITETAAGVAKVTVDNVEIPGYPKVVTPWNTATQYSIGQEYDGAGSGDYWDGFVDDMAVWDRALPDGVIAAMYQGRSPLDFRATSFQEGVDGYTGTQDTHIRQDSPTTPAPTATTVEVDANSGASDERQGLVRFENLFGGGPGQIPGGVEIISAELVITTPNELYADGDGALLHRLLMDWDESDTWNGSFGGDGVDADGIEAMVAAEVDTGPMFAPRPFVSSFDVTDSVQAWHAGADNYGWAFLPRGSNRWAFASSEHGTLDFHPMLTITYRVPEPSTWMLFGLGALGLAVLRAGRRRRTAA